MIGTETSRFRRPMDLHAIRRNNRQVQAQRLLFLAANVCLGLAIIVAATWLYRRTQEDRRFSIQRVETTGALHTSKSAIEGITARYVGANLFRLEIEGLRTELTNLPWVDRVAIEKRIPNTLAIEVFERQPVALLSRDGLLRYVDARGKGFAALDPAVGNPELPLIVNAKDGELPRTVQFLRDLRSADAALYSRVSEISPMPPDGFAIFDRELRSYVVVGGNGWREKWLQVYAIAEREGFRSDGIEYADLRFNDRIVVKPRKMPQTNFGQPTGSASAGITN